jgi:hypothetical protein
MTVRRDAREGPELRGICEGIREKNVVKGSPALQVVFEAKIQFCIMGCEAEEMI